jgi:hypothetical protein
MESKVGMKLVKNDGVKECQTREQGLKDRLSLQQRGPSLGCSTHSRWLAIHASHNLMVDASTPKAKIWRTPRDMSERLHHKPKHKLKIQGARTMCDTTMKTACSKSRMVISQSRWRIMTPICWICSHTIYPTLSIVKMEMLGRRAGTWWNRGRPEATLSLPMPRMMTSM